MGKKSDIILEIEGNDYQIRDNIDIVTSMLYLCNSFTAKTMSIGSKEFKGKTGAPFSLKIDDHRIIKGHLDICDRYLDEETGEEVLLLAGRDNTSDLVDCSYDFLPNEWKDISRGEVIRELCRPFNIKVSIDKTAQKEMSEVLQTYKANEGDYINTMIQGICRDSGVLPLSIGDGNLTISKSSLKVSDTELSQGSNIVGWYISSNNTERYSRYTAKGYGISSSMNSFEDYVGVFGTCKDRVISRERPYVLFPDGIVDYGKCETAIKWDACIKAGLSRRITYKYDSFYEKIDSGNLWKNNVLLRVNDSRIDFQGQWLILGVRFNQWARGKDNGRFTELTLVHPKTFSGGDPSVIKGPMD